MTDKTIEVEAETLEEARERVKSQTSEGLGLLSEKVISDGKPITVTAIAETTEAAFTKAHGEVPSNADVIEKKESAAPKQSVMTVEAFDEQSARTQVGSQIGTTARIKGCKLVKSGNKGLLGIGKKPNSYEVEVLHQAVVEFTYKTKARILAQLGDKEAQLRRRAEQLEAELAEARRELTRAYNSGNDAYIANVVIATVEGRSSPLDRIEKLREELASIRLQLAGPAVENQHNDEL